MNPLLAHPDRIKWNERYRREGRTRFPAPSPLLEAALAAGIPEGPVLELACGLSGNAPALARQGRTVTAVDISDVALDRLMLEARRRGLDGRITPVQADLTSWRPPPDRSFALVFCVMYWDPAVFDYARDAVAPGGILAWQAFTREELRYRVWMKPEWCLAPGEPEARLAPDFTVIESHDHDDGHRATRAMIGRRGFIEHK